MVMYRFLVVLIDLLLLSLLLSSKECFLLLVLNTIDSKDCVLRSDKRNFCKVMQLIIRVRAYHLLEKSIGITVH